MLTNCILKLFHYCSAITLSAHQPHFMFMEVILHFCIFHSRNGWDRKPECIHYYNAASIRFMQASSCKDLTYRVYFWLINYKLYTYSMIVLMSNSTQGCVCEQHFQIGGLDVSNIHADWTFSGLTESLCIALFRCKCLLSLKICFDFRH